MMPIAKPASETVNDKPSSRFDACTSCKLFRLGIARYEHDERHRAGRRQQEHQCNASLGPVGAARVGVLRANDPFDDRRAHRVVVGRRVGVRSRDGTCVGWRRVRVVGAGVVAHVARLALEPIHIATNASAPMPPSQATNPSATAPARPRLKPPGSGVDFTPLT